MATSVFSFISAWNDFLFAKSFIISDTSQSTLPMALLVFYKPDEPDWGGVMAASTVMTIPVLVSSRTRTATPGLQASAER